MDVGVSGPKFGAASVPSLKQFLRDVTKVVPSPKGGTVFENWQKTSQPSGEAANPQETTTTNYRPPAAQGNADVPVGDLGSGSDYTVFLQHLRVPSSGVSSRGSCGGYYPGVGLF